MSVVYLEDVVKIVGKGETRRSQLTPHWRDLMRAGMPDSGGSPS